MHDRYQEILQAADNKSSAIAFVTRLKICTPMIERSPGVELIAGNIKRRQWWVYNFQELQQLFAMSTPHDEIKDVPITIVQWQYTPKHIGIVVFPTTRNWRSYLCPFNGVYALLASTKDAQQQFYDPWVL